MNIFYQKTRLSKLVFLPKTSKKVISIHFPSVWQITLTTVQMSVNPSLPGHRQEPSINPFKCNQVSDRGWQCSQVKVRGDLLVLEGFAPIPARK